MSASDVQETEVVNSPDPPESAEEAYDALLNGVLNHGCKTVTALAMGSSAYTFSNLYAATLREAGWDDDGPNRYISHNNTVVEYVKNSFLDIGMVAEERVTSASDGRIENATAYSLSPFGHHMQPVLAYTAKAVKKADELDELNTVLGHTSSTGETRAPANTVRILEALAGGATTQRNIVDSYDRFSGTALDSERLETLKENNVIQYSRPKMEGGQRVRITDEIYPEDVEPVHGHTYLTTEIVEQLESGETIRAGELTENLEYSGGSVSRVLHGLTEQEDVGLETVPELQLTRKGYEANRILDTTAIAVNRYMGLDGERTDTGEVVDVMPGPVQEAWDDYQENMQRFRLRYNLPLWNAARDASPHVGKLDSDEAQELIATVVREITRERGEHPTTFQLVEAWNRRFPAQKRNRSTVHRYGQAAPDVVIEERGEGIKDHRWTIART